MPGLDRIAGITYNPEKDDQGRILDFMNAPWARSTVALLILFAGVLLLHFITRRFIFAAVHRIIRRTRAQWDEEFFAARVPHRAAFIVPLLVFRFGLTWIDGLSPALSDFLLRLTAACMILVGAVTIDAILTALHRLYQRLPVAATRPIKSYVQLGKIAMYAIAVIVIVGNLAGKSPLFLVSYLGAMTAIILLIFRDTLLSLVASVQLTNNDLVRVGDWIEMPQFDADGDVVDIALNTVKVQNWDKTVTVIPTHKFLEHSFRNWRAMFETGGRRIKRAIHINTSTIRFLTEEEIERFSRFALLRDYMQKKIEELRAHNAQYAGQNGVIMNARRLTNIGTLRAYIDAYLRNHPKIRQDMTLLVRQLAPTPEGVPIEIYAFTADTRWAFYETIQADIFDHILSMVPEFGLSVYQRPSGRDVTAVFEEV